MKKDLPYFLPEKRLLLLSKLPGNYPLVCFHKTKFRQPLNNCQGKTSILIEAIYGLLLTLFKVRTCEEHLKYQSTAFGGLGILYLALWYFCENMTFLKI
ncbi:hypothetical protein MNBD_BACTEROID01-1776 [hydrothermal vent metagenome]|uniref:Uncharacterized protein n=1 Tax=hydrothermal vent metagenome TaxID=652676 RepID=A0A3B0TWY5_9ZZZZ